MTALSVPSCPHCGYDLSGVVASWKESCPLEGVCSECGLAFCWREVMCVDSLRLRGFYEHATGVALISAWKTWVWTLLPWVFWNRVRLEHPVHLRRLFTWLLVLLLTLQLLHVGHIAARLVFAPAGIYYQKNLMVAVLEPLVVVHWQGETRPGWEEWPIFVLPSLAFLATLTLTLLALPQTRARARVRFTHVMRVAVYGLSWVVALGIMRLANEMWSWSGYYSAADSQSNLGLWARWTLPEFLNDFFIMAWLSCWWFFALRQGLRLSRWLSVWLVTMLLGAISAVIVLCFISADFAAIVDSPLRFFRQR